MYARIQPDETNTQNGVVAEIIEPFYWDESGRPAMPEELPEDATDEARAAYAVAVTLHNQYPLGEEVAIAARFTPELAANIYPCPANVTHGWRYDDGVYSEPAPYVPPPMSAEQAASHRNTQLDYATQQINPLQDLVEIGESTPADEARLLAWKKYRAAVGKTNTQAGWPSDVNWPAAPDA